MARLISEKQLQAAIVEAAEDLGWWTYHPYDSRRSNAGWPDLVIARPGQVIFAELKDHDGKVTPEQGRVLELLESAGFEVHVWRPADYDDALARLQEVRCPPA